MDMHELTRELKVKNDSKIVMLVADGLGGLPLEPGGKTELETARTPNLDELAAAACWAAAFRSSRASRPGAGRGTWDCSATIRCSTASAAARWKPPASALSSGRNDVAVRGNFCTLDAHGQDQRSPRRPHQPARRALRWRSSCGR